MQSLDTSLYCRYNTCDSLVSNGAIFYGLDLLSLSLGLHISITGKPLDISYDFDAIMIGSLRAIQKGVFASCSTGNDKLSPSAISNSMAWTMTIGPSTIDGEFASPVVLGNIKYIGDTHLHPMAMQ